MLGGCSGPTESDEILIIYNVNSFSSLIACYVVRLDEQFELFSGTLEVFSGQRWEVAEKWHLQLCANVSRT